MIELNEMVREFLVESHENLDQLDRDLLSLEQDPSSQPMLASVFRTIHTIKGTCGFLGFGKLESLSHVGENLLCKLRDRELTLNAEITGGLLAQVDAIREMLDCIERTGAEGNSDYTGLIARLSRLQQADGSSSPTANDSAVEEPAPPATPHVVDELMSSTPVAAESPESLKNTQETRLAEATIRVDVSLLDKLMNRVGELVLARNQILQFTGLKEDAALLSTCQRLNLITTELQEGVMKTRMQPIDTIWNKFPRIVRDLALQCGKQVRVEMEGKETELDKTIVEAIKDPMTHLVRNSVDHGIE